MSNRKETFAYVFFGLALVFMTFFPLEFLDIPLGWSGLSFNVRVLVFLSGIFIVIFPPSEPIRISSLGSWILDLVKSIRGKDNA